MMKPFMLITPFNHTFTELFYLLKLSNHLNATNHSEKQDEETSMILRHSDNAITGILHGLQAIGSLIATSTLIEKNDVVQLGHFLTLIANLMDALNILRSDCEFHLYENDQEIEIIHISSGQ